MRAVVAKAKGEAVSVETIVVPDPGPNDVVTKISAYGVCHTDLDYRVFVAPASRCCRVRSRIRRKVA
ncbi:hypothetical protein RhoFasB10_03102 [Rhodococcus sp. B10]|nr:hypothetical protein [Rhodococcus sp. B10]